MSKPGETHAVYQAMYEGELLYVGSSIDLKSRLGQHQNEYFRQHGPFGRYIHKQKIANDIKFSILQEFKGWTGTRDDLKKELRTNEFLWKNKLDKQQFGQNDGVMFQPIEVQRKVANTRNRKSRAKRIELDPVGEHKKEALRKKRHRDKMMKDPERKFLFLDKKCDYQRKRNAEKAKESGRKIFKPRGKRTFCPNRAAVSKIRREIRAKSGKKSRMTRHAILYEVYLEVKPDLEKRGYSNVIKCFEFL